MPPGGFGSGTRRAQRELERRSARPTTFQPSLTDLPRRATRVITVRDRVLVADLSVPTLNFQLAATFIFEVATRCFDRLALSVMSRTRS